MAKYDALGVFLRRWARKHDNGGVDLSFDQIEGIIQATLPKAANAPRWWCNEQREAHSRSWLDAGFEALPTAEGDRVFFRRRRAPFPSPVHAPSLTDRIVVELVRRSREANAALMRGDVDRYRNLVKLTGDFTLMSPFGGTPTVGSDMTEAQWQAMGRFFRNGTLEQELVQAYASRDMVVLAIIERAHVEVGGLPAQDWALRVTLVYRRAGSEWQLAHRHADPLVTAISLERAAALARGERGNFDRM